MKAKELDWIDVNEHNPKNYSDGILAAHIVDDEIYWIASLWYDDDYDEWNCDFTDEEFNNIGYRSFTHFIPLTEH